MVKKMMMCLRGIAFFFFFLFVKHSKKLRAGLRLLLCAGTVVKWNQQRTCLVFAMSVIATGLGLMLWLVLRSSSDTTGQCENPGQAPAMCYDDLKKVIASSFECRENPGMIMAVVKDGKTVLSEAYGVLLPGSNVKVTTGTKYLISSLTKAFTAALLVSVFHSNSRNHSYELDTPLSDILGKNFSFADEERTKYGSAEDLLSHRIGLPNKGFMRFNPSFNRSDFLYFPRYWKTGLPFRGTAKYSSVTYTLAAAIAEELGGKTWEDLVKERLFDPIGMTDTGFAFYTNFSADDVAKPYATLRGRKSVIDPLFTRVWNSRCGSGCIVSTADDMAKWMNFILTHGQNAEGKQVLPNDQVKTLTKIRTYLRSSRRDLISKPVFPATSVADEYALGWRNGLYEGYKLLSHTGSSPGFVSMLMLYPEEKLGIFVAMNGDDDRFYYRMALVHLISDYMFGRTPWLNATSMCSFPNPWKAPHFTPDPIYEKGLKPALPYIEYIGAYKSPVYGELFVNFNQSTFSLQGFYGVGSWELFPQKETNNFYGKGILATDFWDIPDWQFITSEKDAKNVTRLMVKGFDVHDPPIFEKEFN